MNGRQLQVGFLVDNLTEEYQRRVFDGLNHEALRLNVNVRAFVGGPLALAGAAAQRNQLYDCVSAAHLDAVVISAGTLGNQVGADALQEFVTALQPLPMCSLGVPISGLPTVTIDNRTGVRQALVHLLQDAGRRRIAFLRGPEHNSEAEERFQVYREVLQEHGLALNPDLIAFGDFEAPSGAEAIRTLIDERHVGFDAVVAASDLMALGALNALIERGVHVPERVSVVGFDDLEPARFAAAPLTTVRQPLAELGKRALGNVVKQIYKEPHDERVVLPAELIRRRSSVVVQRISRIPEALVGRELTQPSDFEEAYREVSFELHATLLDELALEGLDNDWPAQLCSAFVSEVCGRRTGLLKRVTFVDYLEQLLLKVADLRGDLSACQDVISTMRLKLLPWLHSLPPQRELAEQLWHRARMLIAGIAERYQVQQRLELSYWRRSVQELGAALMRCGTLEALSTAVTETLPQLGIPACAICTFEAPDMSRLRIAYDLYEAAEYPVSVFPERELLPKEILSGQRRTSLVVESLYDAERAIGYAVFEMGPTETEVYSLLADYLTGALRGIELDYEEPDYVPEPPPGAVSEL